MMGAERLERAETSTTSTRLPVADSTTNLLSPAAGQPLSPLWLLDADQGGQLERLGRD
jgi:hypothetical protein